MLRARVYIVVIESQPQAVQVTYSPRIAINATAEAYVIRTCIGKAIGLAAIGNRHLGVRRTLFEHSTKGFLR